MPALARFGLEDKIVIVTGAGRGIGRTIALECFQSGAKLAVGSRTTGELETLAAEIRESVVFTTIPFGANLALRG